MHFVVHSLNLISNRIFLEVQNSGSEYISLLLLQKFCV